MGCATSSPVHVIRRPNGTLQMEAGKPTVIQSGPLPSAPSPPSSEPSPSPAPKPPRGLSAVLRDEAAELRKHNLHTELAPPSPREASASSIISNISTGSRSMSYDFRMPGEGVGPGKLPPAALRRKITLSKESSLTMEKLQEKLEKAKERRERLLANERLLMDQQIRPKTMQASERVRTALATRAGGRGKEAEEEPPSAFKSTTFHETNVLTLGPDGESSQRPGSRLEPLIGKPHKGDFF